MNNIYWNINTPVENCKCYEDNEFKDLDENFLNSYIFNTEEKIHLSLPLNYFSNKESYEIELSNDKKYTVLNLFNLIYDFYNSDLTENELTFIKKMYDNNVLILEKNYSKLREEFNVLLYNAYNNKGKRKDILGSRNIYEGFLQLNNNSYKLLLGY